MEAPFTLRACMQLTIALVVFTQLQAQASATCPDGWFTYEDNCYLLCDDSQNFHNARDACRDMSAELTSQHSTEEHQFILDQMINRDIDTMWIGLHDLSHEGQFEWLDGTPLNYTNWRINADNTKEPNSWRGRDEDCVDMKTLPQSDHSSSIISSGIEGSWNDEECSTLLPYMCKKAIPATCPHGWEQFNTTCYYFDHTIDKLTFAGAEEACENLLAKLVVIHSQQEQDFLAGHLQTDPRDTWHYYYIGLHDTTLESHFQWIDGSRVDFRAWTQGEPNNAGNEDCVGLWPERGGTWNDYPCSKLSAFICEKPLDEFSPSGEPRRTVAPPTAAPQSEVIPLVGRPAEQSSTHNDAVASKAVDGNTNGYYFGSGLSAQCTHTSFSQSGNAWWFVDMGDTYCVGRVAIFNRADCCGDRLTDAVVRIGSDATKTNNPVCGTVTDDMIAQSLELEVTCALKGRYLSVHLPVSHFLQLCEVQAFTAAKCEEVPTPVTPSSSPSSTCPSGWESFGDSCYIFDHIIDNLNYTEAETACEEDDAHLVIIHSQDEQDFLAGHIRSDPNDRWHYYRIGLHDSTTEGSFQWIDGSPVDFRNWAPGEPNDFDDRHYASPGEDCAGLWPDEGGQWNDYDCFRPTPYICEKPKESSRRDVTTESPVTRGSFDCTILGSDWVYWDQSCYFYSTSQQTWVDKDTTCRTVSEYKGHIAVVNSQEEDTFMRSVLASARTWLGCRGNGNGVWTCADHSDVNMHFYNSRSGQREGYWSWDRGQPNEGIEQCVVRYVNGVFHDFQCDYTGHKFAALCEVSVSLLDSSTGSSTDPNEGSGDADLGLGSCPANWEANNGYCYFVSSVGDEKTFNDAQTKCLSMEAELPSIHSSQENDFLLKLMRRNRASTMWIGMHDTTNEGDFEWTDKTNVDFTDWVHHTTGTNEPNSYGGGEDCVDMKRGGHHNIESGSWNDEKCCGFFRYSCKKEISSSCPEDIFIGAESGSQSTNVTWEEPFIIDSMDPASQIFPTVTTTRSHDPGQEFPIGATTVRYNFTDTFDNSFVASCTFTIFVNDTTQPIITGCPKDIVVTAELGTSEMAVEWTKPTTSDFGELATSRTHAPGDSFGAGLTKVEYKFTDIYGNSAVCAFTVTLKIEDTVPPVVSGCPSDIWYLSESETKIDWDEPTASDLSGSPVVIRSHAPGTKFPVGVTSVSYVFIDTSFNQANCTFSVSLGSVGVPAHLNSGQNSNASALTTITAILAVAVVALIIAMVAIILYFRKNRKFGDIQMTSLVNDDNF